MIHASTMCRRSVLAGFAALGASTPLRAHPCSADASDPELSAIYREFVRASAAVDAQSQLCEAAWTAYFKERPRFPEAAIATDADLRLMLFRNVGERYDERDIPRLSHRPMLNLETGMPCQMRTGRAQEIVQALDQYRAADQTARVRSGLASIEERVAEAMRVVDEIKARMLVTPAKSLAGVLLKARVIEWSYSGDPPDAEDFAAEGVSAETFAMSVAVDLLRLTRG